MKQAAKKEPSLSEVIVQAPKVKFEVYGQEMVEKEVKSTGQTGRVYLPPAWIGQKVKIIKT